MTAKDQAKIICKPAIRRYASCPLAACLVMAFLLTGCLTPQEKSIGTTDQTMNFAKAGQFTQAIEAGKIATAQNPSYAAAWYWLGYAYFCNKQYEDALSALQKRMALNQTQPQYSSCCLMVGKINLIQHQNDEAVLWLTKAAGLEPTNSHAFNDLGVAYARTGKVLPAIEAYTIAAELAPNDSVIKNNLAGEEKRLGEPRLDDFVAPFQGVNGPTRGIISFIRWRDRMLIEAKNQSLPKLLRDGKTSELSSLSSKVEQAILDYTHESETLKDRAERAIQSGSTSQDLDVQRELALVYKERVVILKSILTALKEETANRSK